MIVRHAVREFWRHTFLWPRLALVTWMSSSRSSVKSRPSPVRMTLTRTLIKNLRWRIKTGIRAGLTFTVIAVIAFVLDFKHTLSAKGLTFLAVAAAYLGGGVVAGAIVGALRPLGRSRLGAVLLGVIACVPVAIAIRLAAEGFTPWTRGDSIIVGLMAVGFGGVSGFTFHEAARRGQITVDDDA